MRAVMVLEAADYKKHSAVIAHFRREYIKNGTFDVSYSSMIGTASMIRSQCDYVDLFKPDAEELELLLKEASAFIGEVEAFIRKSISE